MLDLYEDTTLRFLPAPAAAIGSDTAVALRTTVVDGAIVCFVNNSFFFVCVLL